MPTLLPLKNQKTLKSVVFSPKFLVKSVVFWRVFILKSVYLQPEKLLKSVYWLCCTGKSARKLRRIWLRHLTKFWFWKAHGKSASLSSSE